MGNSRDLRAGESFYNPRQPTAEPMGIEIREATLGDGPSLEIVRRQAIEASFSDAYSRSEYADIVASPDPNLHSWIESEAVLVLVAESPVTPVSFAVLDRNNAELHGIYTSPDYRRRGYATALLDEIESRVSTEIDSISVWAPKPARPFFRAVGFDGTKEQKGEAIVRIRMTKSLAEGR